MATAKATEIEVVKKTDGFVLTLSGDEAQTLLFILASVGGDPHQSRRKHADAILYALRDAGVTTPHNVIRDGKNEKNGTIYFNNREDI